MNKLLPQPFFPQPHAHKHTHRTQTYIHVHVHIHIHIKKKIYYQLSSYKNLIIIILGIQRIEEKKPIELQVNNKKEPMVAMTDRKNELQKN